MREAIHQASFPSGSPMEKVEIEVHAETLPQPWPRRALTLSINHFAILVMPDTVEGGRELYADIETLRACLGRAQKAISDHLDVKEGKR